jgi:hypothetical protein
MNATQQKTIKDLFQMMKGFNESIGLKLSYSYELLVEVYQDRVIIVNSNGSVKSWLEDQGMLVTYDRVGWDIDKPAAESLGFPAQPGIYKYQYWDLRETLLVFSHDAGEMPA